MPISSFKPVGKTLWLIHNEDGLANAAELELDLELGGSREGEDTDHAGHQKGGLSGATSVYQPWLR